MDKGTNEVHKTRSNVLQECEYFLQMTFFPLITGFMQEYSC